MKVKCKLFFLEQNLSIMFFFINSFLNSKVLTLYHTILTSKDPEKEKVLKTLWEKLKMLVTSTFSFFHNVFYPSQNNFQVLGYIYFVVCKSFELRLVYNFSFGKELNLSKKNGNQHFLLFLQCCLVFTKQIFILIT